ncbi:MAG TPA: hypothetical protein VGN89_01130 [Phenylobacterium sp.]|nr:hypothetical protein [Phenylobacterium sp.]
MSSADVHQILIPYLAAGGATALIVLIAAALLKRDGARRKEEAENDRTPAPRQSADPRTTSAKQ